MSSMLLSVLSSPIVVHKSASLGDVVLWKPLIPSSRSRALPDFLPTIFFEAIPVCFQLCRTLGQKCMI